MAFAVIADVDAKYENALPQFVYKIEDHIVVANRNDIIVTKTLSSCIDCLMIKP